MADARHDGEVGLPVLRYGAGRRTLLQAMLSVRMETACLRICAAQPLSSLVFC
jgi:hypothetical protein